MSHAIALPPPTTIAAFDEFLASQPDDAAWELIDGDIQAMTNPTANHEEIVGNLAAALRPMLPADRRCRMSAGGLRVQMSDDARATHAPRPDLMVWCGRMDGSRNFATMPLIIVETLSPSIMDSDRGAKLRFYKTSLPTLRHIALVYQDQMRIENYMRADTGWDLQTLTHPDDTLAFAALLFAMPLSDVYGGVELPSG
jgi:Uma2 family endonuclease